MQQKGVPTDNNIPGNLFVQNTIIAGCPVPVLYSIAGNTSGITPTTANTTATIQAWFSTASYGNSILTNTTDAGLTAPFNYLQPDFNPSSATSASATGAAFTNPRLTTIAPGAPNSGITTVSYKGACAVGDTWWKSWTKYM